MIVQLQLQLSQVRHQTFKAQTQVRPGHQRNSTWYSMAASTQWSKNTNFHAFMDSKSSISTKPNHILNVNLAPSEQSHVLDMSDDHWETIRHSYSRIILCLLQLDHEQNLQKWTNRKNRNVFKYSDEKICS